MTRRNCNAWEIGRLGALVGVLVVPAPPPRCKIGITVKFYWTTLGEKDDESKDPISFLKS